MIVETDEEPSTPTLVDEQTVDLTGTIESGESTGGKSITLYTILKNATIC